MSDDKFVEIGELTDISPDFVKGAWSNKAFGEPIADDIAGLRRRADMVLQGEWVPQPLSELFAGMQPAMNGVVESFRKLGQAFELLGRIEGQSTELMRFMVYFPMDRRQARRVARKTGRKFSWINGEPRWRDAKR
jgi:hypothetical protein